MDVGLLAGRLLAWLDERAVKSQRIDRGGGVLPQVRDRFLLRMAGAGGAAEVALRADPLRVSVAIGVGTWKGKAAPAWLRMSASRGETVSVGPLPLTRGSEVATKCTADLSHPVCCTTRARRRSATSASIAGQWSSRSRAAARGIPDEPGEDGVRLRPDVRVARVFHAFHATGRDRQAGGPRARGVDNPDGLVVPLT